MDNIFERFDKPYSYYHDLRASSDLSYVASDDSRVIEVPDEGLRLLHISHLMLTTIPGASGFGPTGPIRKPISVQTVLWSVAAFMGMIHFNERNGMLIPRLGDRLAGCNLHLTMDMLDSQISPIVAARQFIEATSRNHSLSTPRPGAVVGAFSSDTTLPLAVLSGADQIPHVGGIPSAATFDFKDQYPTFARTVPTAEGHAAAMMELLKHLNVTHVGWVYQRGEYGQSFFGYFQQLALREQGMTITSANYERVEDEGGEESIRRACEAMKASGYRYIIAVGNPRSIEGLLEVGYHLGIAGPGFQWITASLSTSNIPFDATRSNLVSAFKGILSVELDIPPSLTFLRVLQDFLDDEDLHSFFVESHPESFIWDNFAFNEIVPITSNYASTLYDAIMSVGISACEAKSTFFTGLEQYDQLKNTSFSGASGDIAFDSTTGTRKLGGLKYAWASFHVDDELSTNGTVVFAPWNPVTIDFALDNPVVINTAIIFSDNTTTAPAPLPPVEEIDQNLIPLNIRIFGWSLAGLLIVLSIGFAGYTYLKRRTVLIRASQPIFLGMLCVGTVIMASSIIPLSLQEPIQKEGLDIACMSVPWLYTIGFSTAFSALFTKAWRINKVMRNSVEMQRVQVHARDVIWPFVLLTMTNLIILTTWTAIAPLQWTRTFSSTIDQYGRGLETYGTCTFAAGESRVFLLLLAIFNGLAVVLANYQSYIGRNNPSDFNESTYVTLSMASLLECFLIGGSLLVLLGENPEADFCIKAILIFVSCCSMLLPIFIPKFTTRKGKIDMGDIHRSMHDGASRIRSSTESSLGGGDVDDDPHTNNLRRKLDKMHQARRSQSSRISSHVSTDSVLASSVMELRRNAASRSILTAASNSS